jgi:hypothetical protein
MKAGDKLVDASLKALGRCLDTTFTCVQTKSDPSQLPACLEAARKRCDVEFANLNAASKRPGTALQKTCGDVDFATLRAASGLLLEALASDCKLLGGDDPATLPAYADCLVRSHRCGVAELSRFQEPRAEELLAAVGRSLDEVCGLPTPTATATPCYDAFEPNAFPGTFRRLDDQCGAGGCTDDGYELDVAGNISDADDDDFYIWDVQDTPRNDFQIIAQLKNLPKGVNYDLYLYRRNGDVFEQVGASTNDRDSNETIRYDGLPEDEANTGQYGIEVRRVSGSSCAPYTLEVQDGN